MRNVLAVLRPSAPPRWLAVTALAVALSSSIAPARADDLAAALAKAEAALPPERVTRFGRFEGTVMVQGAEEHGGSHGAHAAQPPHPK